MERKIGEIFEYNGEWYQCLPEILICVGCAFKKKTCKKIRGIRGECQRASRQTDGVIFKKLEKVGEPYMMGNKLIQRYKIYPTIHCINVYGWYYQNLDVESWTIDIEIKQTKEDMEENKTTFPKEDNALTRTVYAYVNGEISDKELIRSIKEMSDEYPYNKNNLKPFSLELAKQGKPVCTRDGRKARIICFDRNDIKPIVALVTFINGTSVIEKAFYYFEDGYHLSKNDKNDYDLMMLPEKKEGWVNVYKTSINYECGTVFSTEQEAKNKTNDGRITTVKIEWEE